MTKFVIFTPGKSTGGGMATVAEDHYSNLVKYGIDAVLVETSGKGFLGKILALIKALFISFNFIISCFFCRRIAPKFVFHVASKNSFYRKFILWCFVRIFFSKTVIHLHGGQFIDFYDSSNYFVRFCIRIFFLNSNLVFVLGNKWKTWLVDEFSLTRVEVLPNGIYLENMPDPMAHIERDIDFLFVGRVENKKGARDLIIALNDPYFFNVKAVFVGNILDQSIVDVCTNPGVSFVGQVMRCEVEKYLCRAKFFVLPSYFEAFPVSILEAQKFGAIVISSDVGSVPDIITDSFNGYLVNPGDVGLLTNKLRDAYKKYSSSMPIVYAASLSLKRYEISGLILRIKRFYETI